MSAGGFARQGSLIRQLQGAAQGERRVRGTVNGATGAAITGSGWSSSRIGLGSYTVTFSAAFGGTPTVVVGSTQSPAGVSAYNIEAVGISATGFSVTVREPGIAFIDCSFGFIAIGP